MEAVIVDPTVISQTFPILEKPSVYRESQIDTIEKILKDNVDIVIVEGEEDIGKTTMLAQFANKNSNNSITYFIKPTNRYSYSPDLIMIDLCNQIQFVLNKDKNIISEEVDSQIYQGLMYDLHRHANRYGKTFYFIVDGIEEIPSEDKGFVEAILGMLWFGYARFKFILTGDDKLANSPHFKKCKFKTHFMQEFSLHETMHYYSDITNDKNILREVHAISKKPGVHSSIKRIFKNSGEINTSLIDGSEIEEVFEQEWKCVGSNDKLKELLAIIAYDKKENSISDLSRISEVAIDEVFSTLKIASFIVFDTYGQIPKFVTESFKKFSKKKLLSIKEEISSKIIDDLIKQPDSAAKLNLLPSLFEDSGRFDLLLNYLSLDYFNKVIDCCQSFSAIRQTADRGIQSALSLKKDRDLMRIGLQRSILTELDHGDLIRSEIEARMALGEEEKAVAIAQGISTNEEKLHALAVIARIKRSKGLRESAEVGEQIRQLYEKISPEDLGEKAYSIAEDLVSTNPEMAVELVEKSRIKLDDKSELDLLLAKLSVNALGLSKKSDNSETFENLNSKIKDPRLKKFVSNLSLLLDEYTASDVIHEVKKFDNIKESLFYLKEWISVNRDREDVAEVIEYTLNLIVSSTQYSPNASDYRQIASPIPFLKDSKKRQTLIKSLDGQKGTIEKFGPTEEIVRLDLILAHSVYEDNKQEGSERFVESLLNIIGMTDLALKTTCLSHYVATLKIMDLEEYLEPKERLHSLSNIEFVVGLTQLLESTAHHYDTVKEILKSISQCCHSKSLDIAMSLNIQPHRDEALSQIVRSYSKGKKKSWDFKFLGECLDQIRDYEVKEKAFADVLEMFAADKGLTLNNLKNGIKFIARVSIIKNFENRARLCCLCIDTFKKFQDPDVDLFIKTVIGTLEKTWSDLEEGWIKINIGFKIVRAISEYSKDVAHKYMESIEEIRKQEILESYSHALNYVLCVYLAIRAFGALIANKTYSDDDLEEIFVRIEQVSSVSEKLKMFSVLSTLAFLNKDVELSRQIFTRKIRANLERLVDSKTRYDTLIFCAPAIYCAHKLTFFELVNDIPFPQRDRAYICVIEFILMKVPVVDPFDQNRGQVYKIDYENVLDICEILEKMESDSMIYSVIEKVSDSITSKRAKHVFSFQQKTKIFDKMCEVINSKFPSEFYIKHSGYKIIAKAKAFELIKTSIRDWSILVEEARAIVNIADRIYVLGVVDSSLSIKEKKEIGNLAKEAYELVEKIPSSYDKIGRYELLADLIKESDPKLSRECMRMAMLSTKDASEPNIHDIRKGIIDLAYRIDPEYANKLTSIFDDDPARLQNKHLTRHIKHLEMKQRLGEDIGDSLGQDDVDYSNVCWRALSSLNAGRMASISIERIRNIINVASRMPMDEAYPVLCFVSQNLVKKYGTEQQIDSFVRPFYDATIMGAKISIKLAGKNANAIEKTIRAHAIEPVSEVIIKIGDRDRALQLIVDWITEKAQEYIKITDPYFGVNDLDWLQLIDSAKKDLQIYIVTSKKQQSQDGIKGNYEEEYNRAWRLHVSVEDPPNAEIFIVGTKGRGDSPIHDRWIVSKNHGLKIGTSLNSIGTSKVSEISELTEQGRIDKDEQINQIINREMREIDGERLQYSIFNLS